MAQFFVPSSNINLHEGSSYITGEEFHHLTRVLRKHVGDKIKIFTEDGQFYNVEIIDINKNGMVCKIIEKIIPEEQCKVTVTLYQAILKPVKMDFVIRKVTELGVSNIVPIITQHTIAKIHDVEKKIDRWKKIILSAVKQSELSFLPKIFHPMCFNKAIDLLTVENTFGGESICKDGKTLSLLFHEKYGDRVSEFFTKVDVNLVSRVNIFIGPEGGFSEKEVLLAKRKNFSILNLGRHILRSETSSIVAVSLVLFWAKEM